MFFQKHEFMDKNTQTIINIDEIRHQFKEYCKEHNLKYSDDNFQLFLNFLEVDFYDWIKDNLKYFLTAATHKK